MVVAKKDTSLTPCCGRDGLLGCCRAVAAVCGGCSHDPHAGQECSVGHCVCASEAFKAPTSDAPTRRRLPDTRNSITHKVEIADPVSGTYDVYLTVGLYEDGSPGELFIQIGKAGSTLNALMDTIGIMASFALQYGVPLEHLCRKLRDMNFSPQGKTSNPDVPECTSIIDYVFRWVQENFAEVHVGAQLEKMAASPMNEGEHYEP